MFVKNRIVLSALVFVALSSVVFAQGVFAEENANMISDTTAQKLISKKLHAPVLGVQNGTNAPCLLSKDAGVLTLEVEGLTPQSLDFTAKRQNILISNTPEVLEVLQNYWVDSEDPETGESLGTTEVQAYGRVLFQDDKPVAAEFSDTMKLDCEFISAEDRGN